MVASATKSFGSARKGSGAFPAAALKITILSGPGEGRSVSIAKPVVLVGRSEAADCVLTDSMVSAFHAELRANRQDIYVCDCGSTNGLCIADHVWIQSGWVQSGTTIRIGRTFLRLEIGDEIAPSLAGQMSFGALVGASPAMRACFTELELAAQADISILLLGETGTGKELAARAIHQHSRRAAGPFKVLDSTAIPPSLAQSTLFGHKKGSFTGAVRDQQGIFEAASGGVLFIDEVGELSPELQAMLLRALQEKVITPIGGVQISVDVRVICATHRDLKQMVNAGRFRGDLYQRLATPTLTMPSLEERREDIPMLINHFVEKYSQANKVQRMLDPRARDALIERDYPGNVRELEKTVELIIAFSRNAVITCDDLVRWRAISAKRSASPLSPAGVTGSEPVTFRAARETQARAYLVGLMARHNNNVSRAAREARLSRPQLRKLLVKHQLRQPGPTEDVR